MMKEKVMIENKEKMLRAKVKQKRDWAETKKEGFWADFFREKKSGREKKD